MADLAIYHPDIERGGGAEAVCLHMIDALESEHNLTLLTCADPNLSRLDARYGTNATGADIEVLGSVSRRLIAGTRCSRIRNAVYSRAVQNRSSSYDGVISAYNELTTPDGALQYVHHPNYRCPASPEQEPKPFGRTYDWISKSIARLDVGHGTLLTNSEWMASILEECWKTRPSVVYPPITTIDLPNQTWEDRENAILHLGRVARDKRPHIAIEIAEQLQARGNDLDLHIVGNVPDTEYAATVRTRADPLNFVTVHDSVTRAELTTLLGRVRYGLHTKEYEHFGMAVAEMVGAGLIPFVPNSGGQVEIVGGIEELVYSTVDEATRKSIELWALKIARNVYRKDSLTLNPDTGKIGLEKKFESTPASGYLKNV